MTKYIALCCLDIIESTYRHDFVRCKCGKAFVDGGNDYLRAGGVIRNYEEYTKDFENQKEIADAQAIYEQKKAGIPTDTIGS